MAHLDSPPSDLFDYQEGAWFHHYERESLLSVTSIKEQDLEQVAALIRQARRNQQEIIYSTGSDNLITMITKHVGVNLINQIPDEVFENHIFPFLSIEILARECSLVCKKWSSLVGSSLVSIQSCMWREDKQKHLTSVVKLFKCVVNLSMRQSGKDDYDLVRFVSDNAIELKRLYLQCGHFSNQGHIVTRYLSNGKLFKLEELILRDYELEERGILHLTKQESCLKNLTSLDISDNRIGKHISHLSALENLKSLTLSIIIPDGTVLETLFNGLKNLEKLSLTVNNQLYDSKWFKPLANLSKLKYLRTSTLDNEIAKYLSTGMLTNLKTLALFNVRIADGLLESLFSGNLNEITHLHFISCNSFLSIKPIEQLHSLTELCIAGCHPPHLLEELSHMKHIKLEMLQHKSFTTSTLLYSLNAPIYSSLKVLDLSTNFNIENNLKYILEGQLVHLQDLNLKSTNITDMDMKSIRDKIKETPEHEPQPLGQLTRLNLTQNKIGDEGCRYLSECGGLHNLRKMKLARNCFGKEGSNYLVLFALDRPKLTTLGYSLLAHDN